MAIKKGDRFYAIIKTGPHSKTLDGVEKAGTKLGPFVADAIQNNGTVESGERLFSKQDFMLTGA